MRLLISFALLAALAHSMSGQVKTFRWADETCSYVGTYEVTKLTPAQLTATLKLSRPGSYNLETNTTVWKWADVARLDVATLDREYNEKHADLVSLPIAPPPYWREFRARKLRELEQVYRLNRATMLGYRERKALLVYADAPACTTRFASPLIEGGEPLLTTWRTLNEEERKKNLDPARLRRIFEQQFKSPDKLQYAVLEVMAFGWSNCANALIDYIEYDGTPDSEFQKLFTSVKKLRCQAP
jgi:hypothetical protein